MSEDILESEWNYIETDEGLFGVDIPHGHSLFYDFEGSCGDCFRIMYLISTAPDLLRVCKKAQAILSGYDWNRTVLNDLAKEIQAVIDEAIR